jgi:hypothetical protein
MPERHQRLQSSDADRPVPAPASRRWIRRSDSVVRCWFLVAIAICPASHRTKSLRPPGRVGTEDGNEGRTCAGGDSG